MSILHYLSYIGRCLVLVGIFSSSIIISRGPEIDFINDPSSSFQGILGLTKLDEELINFLDTRDNKILPVIKFLLLKGGKTNKGLKNLLEEYSRLSGRASIKNEQLLRSVMPELSLALLFNDNLEDFRALLAKIPKEVVTKNIELQSATIPVSGPERDLSWIPRAQEILREVWKKDYPDINKKDVGGWTTLHWAAATGNAQAVKLLLENGADFKERTPEGETAYQLAIQYNHPDIANLITSYLTRQTSEIVLRHFELPNEVIEHILQFNYPGKGA